MSSKSSKTTTTNPTTINQSPATESDFTEKRCENCEHSVPAGGSSVPTLICKHKAGADLPWQVVEPDDSCANFEQSREIAPLDIAAALAEGAKLIPLSQGKFAIVDAEDYDRFSKYKWHASNKGQTSYAQRNSPDGIVCMHRLIAGAPPHLVVDHINHNGLDNRKKNLRLCTQAQNIYNSLPRQNCSSKYKGVYLHKRTNRYRATIRYKGKRFHLGTFKNQVDAAKAYDKKAKQLFKEYAYLNFPNE